MSADRKSIFITGAASGMGRATARLFAQKGWFVGIYDVNEQGLEALASEIDAGNCHFRILDVTNRSAYQSVLEEFDDKAGGRLDVLHNNAGIIMGGLFGDMDYADVEKIIQVNLMGVINGIHAAYPLLKKTPNSLCFTTCSSSAILGSPGIAVYSMTKHAIKGLTEALSIELSFFDSRAADVLPGHIETGMMSDEYRDGLPKEGPWRLIPAEAVAEVVWASYYDKTGKLHWYVPEDMAEHQRAVATDIEGARNMSRDHFATVVEKHKNGF